MRGTRTKTVVAAAAAIVIILAGIGFGSADLDPRNILLIIAHKLFGTELPADIAATAVSILWSMRLPRVLLSFIVGAALSLSGCVMQSVLRNSLASPYTLGVSSGSSLGAALTILLGVSLPVFRAFTLPVFGFAFSLGTIVLVIGVSKLLDGRLENNTIVLFGMVVSLFCSAVVTLITAMNRESTQQLVFWQMGSFSMKDWLTVYILLPVTLVCMLVFILFSRELDIMTFGEDEARAIGLELGRVKWIMLVTAAALTGCSVGFVGVIGFVDLISPHIARKIFGANHRRLLPMSALTGGSFMVLCDLIGRTAANPAEVPVGAVSALIGAPFFAYVFFTSSRKRRRG